MASSVIDCDIHPVAIHNLGVLMPYLSKGWQRLIDDRAHLPLLTQLPGRSPRFGDLLKVDATPPKGGPPGSDPEYLLEHHVDRHGIQVGLLIALEVAYLNTWTNPDEAAALAAAANDFLAEQWLTVDDRFRLAMNVAPHDAHLAAAEIRRFGGHDQVSAVFLPLINKHLGHRDFFPIYEAAQELGLTVVVHPDGTEGDYHGCPNFAVGTPPSRHERYSLLIQFGQSNLANIIFEGLFERFPRLKIVFVEYGWTWVPSALWRLDATWKAGRKTTPWVKRSPTEYVLDHVRFTTEPATEPPSEREALQILEMMHAERTLLFSSDYPHWDGDEDPETLFKTAPAALRHRIMRENAIEAFGERLRVPDLVTASGAG
jgi:predicted TIM-barrel fold metal-dependent hydrolase